MENKLIFLDTETTGIGEGHKIVQVAYMYGGKFVNVLLNPEREIDKEAMEVHKITNEMVKDCATFNKSLEIARLKTLIDDGGIIVAHNAEFDVGMLESEGLKCGEYIDTLALAHHLKDNGIENLDKCDLQTLREYYKCKFDEEIRPHDAYSDVVVLKAVYDCISANFADIDEMIRITTAPVMIKTMPFGKYKGKTIEEIAKENIGYLKWFQEQIYKKDEKEMTKFDKNLLYTLSFIL